jgi:hypothetical protein
VALLSLPSVCIHALWDEEWLYQRVEIIFSHGLNVEEWLYQRVEIALTHGLCVEE